MNSGEIAGHHARRRAGALRLSPPDARLPELRRDYAAMGPMFLSPPPPFEDIIDTLREAELAINGMR